MVNRIYVEKKKELAHEANALCYDCRQILGIEKLEDIRIINRYDVENISAELFKYAAQTVFSEPLVDIVLFDHQTNLTNGNFGDSDLPQRIFAVEYLPGQFDQRADSAAQCIQLISHGNRPTVRTAKVYVLYGALTEAEFEKIKKHIINPVEAREASLEKPETLKAEYTIPTSVETLDGFTALESEGLLAFIKERGLAMDLDDIIFCRDYFRSENREPTITEIKMIDTYWSDHCRHTTFSTVIDNVSFEDELLAKAYDEYLATRRALNRTKPVCLMDVATIAVKYLRQNGKLDALDESEEINACTVKIKVTIDDEEQDWLLLFKNETHNHPTEIEPFGGAATCIGGAIRDPLSGRAYVYGAMRLTGAADPTEPVENTLEGKLPQRKIVTTAAAGFSSYGNQIGLATGIVDEIYHPGYAAKRMEIGAVIAAAPAENVRRERPAAGDIVILLGGKTGRDGCGGATGSSKSHTVSSLETCGAEVQKGNAPEERKLQRLFRNCEASRLIKRCNDFGAGGVSVAIGELADGLFIDLNKVPKKYEGLDGTELAISESQERMAVVVAKKDAPRFLQLAETENIEATEVATVTDSGRLIMSWNDRTIVDISRDFLNSNGAPKHIKVICSPTQDYTVPHNGTFEEEMTRLCSDINICSKRGLSERFDSTIGAGTVLMPFGGKYQRTPIQAMVHKIPVEKKHTDDCSLMSWGYNPFITEKSPYHGAYLAVIESVSKLIATGADFSNIYLTFQEYFERLSRDERRWGKPLSALLGAFRAQMELKIGAIGGKDSMSGSFESLDVPPTLVSFAVTMAKAADIISPEFKSADSTVVFIRPEYDQKLLPKTESLLEVYRKVSECISSGAAVSAYTPTIGGICEAVFKMCLGNSLGFSFAPQFTIQELFGYSYGSFILEIPSGKPIPGEEEGFRILGRTTSSPVLSREGSRLELDRLRELYEERLESVYPTRAAKQPAILTEGNNTAASAASAAYVASAPAILNARPRVVIPVFPGTNCEYDTAKAMSDAGADVKIMVLNNLTPADIARSASEFADRVNKSQIIFLPGGFSGADEPDGSGKFITAFFRGAQVRAAVADLIDRRGGLMCGICNGFQALIKLGLVPYGRIIDANEANDIEKNIPMLTLTFNSIARHQSRLVRTKIVCERSPWLSHTKAGEVYTVPISHGEGRFYGDAELIEGLMKNGQVATQYVDLSNHATSDIDFNPNNSMLAIEGITSPDGRIFGKMGHSERIGKNLYKNVDGNYNMRMFESAVEFFKKN